MIELNNIATSIGSYNNIPTSLISNTSAINIIDGLTLTKDADKKNWASGELTYTIALENQTDTVYANPVITDIINNTLVKFVPGSVMIDGVLATEDEYSYNEDTHTLTVNLKDISTGSKTNITFRVEKI